MFNDLMPLGEPSVEDDRKYLKFEFIRLLSSQYDNVGELISAVEQLVSYIEPGISRDVVTAKSVDPAEPSTAPTTEDTADVA